MPTIICVCTANMFRSPLAAAILQREIEQKDDPSEWIVRSAGTWTMNGSPPPPITRQAADRLGLFGMESHRTTQLDESLLDECDLILVMESNHKEAIVSEFAKVKERVFLLSELAEGKIYDIPDPTIPEINADEVADELAKLITTGYRNILDKAYLLSER